MSFSVSLGGRRLTRNGSIGGSISLSDGSSGYPYGNARVYPYRSNYYQPNAFPIFAQRSGCPDSWRQRSGLYQPDNSLAFTAGLRGSGFSFSLGGIIHRISNFFRPGDASGSLTYVEPDPRAGNTPAPGSIPMDPRNGLNSAGWSAYRPQPLVAGDVEVLNPRAPVVHGLPATGRPDRNLPPAPPAIRTVDLFRNPELTLNPPPSATRFNANKDSVTTRPDAQASGSASNDPSWERKVYGDYMLGRVGNG